MEALNVISRVMYLPPVKTKLYKYSNVGSRGMNDLKKKLCRLRSLREFQQELEDVNLLRHLVCYEKQHSINITPFFNSEDPAPSSHLFDAFATLPLDVKREAKQKVDADLQSALRARTSQGRSGPFLRSNVCISCAEKDKIKDRRRPSKEQSSPEQFTRKAQEVLVSTPVSRLPSSTHTLKAYSPVLNKEKTKKALGQKWRDLQKILTQQPPQEEIKGGNMATLIEHSKAKLTRQRTEQLDRVKIIELPRYMKPKHTRMHMKLKFSTWEHNK